MTDSANTQVLQALGRLEGKVDAIRDMLTRHESELAHLDTRMNAAETRLTVIETKGVDEATRRTAAVTKRQYVLGLLGVVAAFLTVLTVVIWH